MTTREIGLFNLYFSKLGVNLDSEIETQLDNNIIDFSQYMDTPASTQFKCITETETLKAIDNLENKNSSGHDGISNKLLKLKLISSIPKKILHFV